MGDVIYDPFRSARLVLSLRQAGVSDQAVVKALETVSRAAFVSDDLEDLAFADVVLPTACGQTVFSPIVAGKLLQALEPGDGVARSLVIGAGCGYLPALVGEFSDEVFAIERYGRLAARADEALRALGADSIHIRQGDGLAGWPERGPFDRILLTGAVDAVPEALIEQLSPQGRLLCSVSRGDVQSLLAVDAQRDRVEHPFNEALPMLKDGVASAL